MRIGKLRAAAVGIDGQLRVVQPQLLRTDLIDPVPQPDDLRSRKKAVTAGNNQMHISGQTPRQHAEETGNAFICQKVKIVYEHIAGCFSRQLAAQIICQQSAAYDIRGAGIVPQEIKALTGKGVLYAFPKDGKVIGIYADPNDFDWFRFGVFCKIPVHRRGLTIAHGRNHRSQGAAGDEPQAFLQALGYVDGIQIPFRFWHDVHLREDII